MPVEHTFPDSAAKNAQGEFETEKMSLSMGPSHPSTHGVLRIQLELDGEVVTKADPVVGYLHRGDEKIAENMTYNQFVPYTDRLDYLAPLANNMAYAIAVERLAKLEVEIPENTNTGYDVDPVYGFVLLHHLRVVNDTPHRPLVNCRVWLERIQDEKSPDEFVEPVRFAVPRLMNFAPADYS